MRKKKVVSLVLALCMVLGLFTGSFTPKALAAGPAASISASKSTVKPGEDVNVTFVLPGVSQLGCAAAMRVYFDNTAFEMTGMSLPAAPANSSATSGQPSDANRAGFFNAMYLSGTGENNVDYSAGFVVTMNFKAKEGAADGSYSFRLSPEYTSIEYYDEEQFDSVNMITVPQGCAAVVNVKGEHVHTWTFDHWNWAQDYSSAQAVFVCAADGLAKNVDAQITDNSVPATCETDGTRALTATAVFENQTYTDTINEPITAPGHDYEIVDWVWGNAGENVTVVLQCKRDANHVKREIVTPTVVEQTVATCEQGATDVYQAAYTINEQEYTDTRSFTTSEAKGHNYKFSEWVWSKDYASASARFVCQNDATHTMDVRASVQEQYKAPTCDKSGGYGYTATASYDGQEYSVTIWPEGKAIPAMNHNWALAEEDAWQWGAEGEDVTVNLVCTHDSTHTRQVQVTPTKTRDDKEDCINPGIRGYEASITLGANTFTDYKEYFSPEALGHDYVLTWNWTSEDSCYATFACTRCTDAWNIDADVQKVVTDPTCEADGKAVSTATVVFENKTYQDTKTFTEGYESHGHSYMPTKWTWGEEGQQVVVEAVCQNNPEHKVTEYVTPEAVDELSKAPTCTEDGYVGYYAVCFEHGSTHQYPRLALKHSWKFDHWEWADDYSSANAVFVCERDASHKENVQARVDESVVSEGKCGEPGVVKYDASVTFENKTYTDTQQANVPGDGHAWKFDGWTWAEDGKTAKAKYVCENNAEHTTEVEAEISVSATTATCETAGTTVYTATITKGNAPDGVERIDTNTVNGTPLGHEYELTEWMWADDYSSAKAKFVCKHDANHFFEVIASVESQTTDPTCETAGNTTYVATVVYNENTYRNVKKVDIKALGHKYMFDGWIWADDNKSAKAVFECENDSEHRLVLDAEMTIDEKPATCEEAGYGNYTAIVVLEKEQYTDTRHVDWTPEGHNYSTSHWEWADDYSSAKLVYVCEHDETHTLEYEAEVQEDITKAECEKDGLKVYTATALVPNASTGENEEVMDIQTVVIKAKGHNWGKGWTVITEPTTGSEGLQTRTCENCEETEKEVIPVITYAVTEGDEGTYMLESGKDYRIVVERSYRDELTFDKFEKLYVDGEEVAKDAYSAEAGSVILTLTAEKMETLKVGEHTFKVSFDDADVEGTFEIKEKEEEPTNDDSNKDETDGKKDDSKKDDGKKDETKKDEGNKDGKKTDSKGSDSKTKKSDENVKTGDTTPIGLWVSIAAASLAMLTVFAVMRKRQVKRVK